MRLGRVAGEPIACDMNSKTMNDKPCKCGCGEIAGKQSHYLRGHAVRGRKYSKERVAKTAAGIAEAHKRGAFLEGHAKRKKETLARRPLCKCGCGKPVKKAAGIYASVECIPLGMNSAERMNALREMRDMEKFRPEQSKRMIEQHKRWVGTEEYEDMRRECRTARGMPDHIAAKAWIIRDPFGKVYKFSNCREWARQNEWRFEDDRPESKRPFWNRISNGFSDLLKATGRSCSYRGWTAVSKLELEDDGKDLLERKAHTGNA
jgi:hypothetical protein